jgi:hypothetical protein
MNGLERITRWICRHPLIFLAGWAFWLAAEHLVFGPWSHVLLAGEAASNVPLLIKVAPRTLMSMLHQTTEEVRLADHKRRHQRAGVAVLTAIPTNSRRIPSRTALNIASAGNPKFCFLTNRGSFGECRFT